MPDHEYTALAGRVAITAPANVREALAQAYTRGNLLMVLAAAIRGAADVEIGERSPEDERRVEAERRAEIEAERGGALAAVDAALDLMREDLARL